VQVRVNVWDSSLSSALCSSKARNEVELRNFPGNLFESEKSKGRCRRFCNRIWRVTKSTFGEIKLDPRMMGGGRSTKSVVSRASGD